MGDVPDVAEKGALAEEGYETYSHGRRLSPKDISTRDLIWQSLGVSPTTVFRFWERKGRLEGRQAFYDRQRDQVRLAYKDALLDMRHNPGDQEARAKVKEALKELKEWNRRVTKGKLASSLRITPKSVRDTVKQELRKERQVRRTGTVPRPKKRGRELEAGYFGY
jgi:uncharacterized protein YfaQ (DUF2300 family)